MRYSVSVPGGIWTIKTDNPTGKTIAQVPSTQLKPTSGWSQLEIPIESTSGVHDLYFLYNNTSLKDPNKTGISFDWFYFYEDFLKEMNQNNIEVNLML